MATKNGTAWTDSEVATLRELVGEGVTSLEIAKRLGRTLDGVNRKRRHMQTPADEIRIAYREVTPAKGTIDDAVQAMAKAAGVKVQPVVTCDHTPGETESAAYIWEQAEARNAYEIERVAKRGVFRSDLGDQPCGVCFVSDQHILEGGAVDLQRMREDAQLIGAHPRLFSVTAGDGVENHIKHRSSVINTEGSPSRQYQLYEYYLQTLNPLVVISGNHDAWTKAFVGVDMVAKLCDDNRMAYAPAEAWLVLTVGGVEYTVGLRHQYRMNSSFNPGHCIKQWLRLAPQEFDIGCIGHHHEGICEHFDYRGTDRVGVRPGSYKITDSHSHQYGYNPTRPTCPTVILHPGEKKMVGFRDVREAAVYLDAITGGA